MFVSGLQDGKESVVKEVYPGDSVHSLLSILDVITVRYTHNLLTLAHTRVLHHYCRDALTCTPVVSSRCHAADFCLVSWIQKCPIEPKNEFLLGNLSAFHFLAEMPLMQELLALGGRLVGPGYSNSNIPNEDHFTSIPRIGTRSPPSGTCQNTFLGSGLGCIAAKYVKQLGCILQPSDWSCSVLILGQT